MAFGAGSSLGGTNDKTAGSTIALTTTATLTAGEMGVIEISLDNPTPAQANSINGTSNYVHTVTDSAGNVWKRQGEFTSHVTTGLSGAVVAVFTTLCTSTLSSGGTITATFVDATPAASAIQGWRFTVGASNTFEVVSRQYTSSNAGDPVAITTPTLPSQEYLLVYALGVEAPSGDGFTADADYTLTGKNGTTGGGAATNSTIYGNHRIATLTSDTVDIASTTSDPDNAAMLLVFKEVAQSATPALDVIPLYQTHTGVDATSHTTLSIQPQPNALLVLDIGSHLAGSTPAKPTSITGHGTWVEEATSTSTDHRITRYSLQLGSSPSASTIAISWGAVTQIGATIMLYEVHGHDPSDGIVQNETGAGTGTSMSDTYTSAFSSTANRPLEVLYHEANETTTQESGHELLVDAAVGSPSQTCAAAWNRTTDDTTIAWSWTGNVDWLSIGSELRQYIVPANATGASTISAITGAGEADVIIAATGVATISAITSAGVAEIASSDINAEGVSVIEAVTGAAEADVIIAATGVATITAITSAAEADNIIAATGASTVEAITSAAEADNIVAATGASTIDAITSAAEADNLVSATGASAVDAITSSGVGNVLIAATGTSTIEAITQAATGTVETRINAEGVSVIEAITSQGTGLARVYQTWNQDTAPAWDADDGTGWNQDAASGWTTSDSETWETV